MSGKAVSVILLGFECRPTINPQNLIKIVRAIFEKFEILNYFLSEQPLILGEGEDSKTARDIYMRILYIEFERDRSIGDGHTDRHIHRHFSKAHF